MGTFSHPHTGYWFPSSAWEPVRKLCFPSMEAKQSFSAAFPSGAWERVNEFSRIPGRLRAPAGGEPYRLKIEPSICKIQP
jgi:hypothetical protein